jgi:hypothetical protein
MSQWRRPATRSGLLVGGSSPASSALSQLAGELAPHLLVLATRVARRGGLATAGALARGLRTTLVDGGRRGLHPLVPAAVRIERSRSQRKRSAAEQVAVTVWFGEGPALPGAGGAGVSRIALRVGASVAAAAALAAASTAVARLGAPRPENLGAAPAPRRLEASSG